MTFELLADSIKPLTLRNHYVSLVLGLPNCTVMSDANLPKKECSSISAIKTTASDGRAPEEFLRKRGYEIVSTIASGGFGKYATLE